MQAEEGKIMLGGALAEPVDGALFIWKNCTQEVSQVSDSDACASMHSEVDALWGACADDGAACRLGRRRSRALSQLMFMFGMAWSQSGECVRSSLASVGCAYDTLHLQLLGAGCQCMYLRR